MGRMFVEIAVLSGTAKAAQLTGATLVKIALLAFLENVIEFHSATDI